MARRPTIRHLLILNVVAAVPLAAAISIGRARGLEREVVTLAAMVAVPAVFS